ncbi:MAG: hypothetical protein QOJ60_1115, partial [Actinomycetota bacterium]|nr:hypothetical protein [Actinomycetota bacterium]
TFAGTSGRLDRQRPADRPVRPSACRGTAHGRRSSRHLTGGFAALDLVTVQRARSCSRAGGDIVTGRSRARSLEVETRSLAVERGTRSTGSDTGEGLTAPSDRLRPAGGRIERRCLLGGQALPLSHPPTVPPARLGRNRPSDLAPGRRLRIAPSLDPKLAPRCVAWGEPYGVLAVDGLRLVVRTGSCQLPPDLRECASSQVSATCCPPTICRGFPRVFGVSRRHTTAQ